MKYIFLSNQSIGELYGKFIEDLSSIEGYCLVVMTGNYDYTIFPNVKFIKSVRYISSNNFLRIFTWFLYSCHLFIYLFFFGNKYSRIMLVSNPPLSFLASARYASRTSYLVYDIYPDVLVDMGYLSKNNLICKIWRYLNRTIFPKFLSIVTLTKEMKIVLEAYMPSNLCNKVVVVEPWFSRDLVPISNQDNILVNSLDLKDYFIITYSGNMGITHPIEIIIEIAKMLHGCKNIKFLIVGEGPKRNQLELLSTGLSNVLFLPRQPHSNLKYILSLSSLSVVVLDRKASNLSLPSKIYSSIATATPILAICKSDSALARMVVEGNLGFVDDGSNISSLAYILQSLSEDQSRIESFRDNLKKISTNYAPSNSKNLVNSFLV